MSIARGGKNSRQPAQSGTKNDVRNAVRSHCRLVRTQALAPCSQCQPLDRFRLSTVAQERWSHIFSSILLIRKRSPSASNFGGLCARCVQGRSLSRFPIASTSRDQFQISRPTISVTVDAGRKLLENTLPNNCPRFVTLAAHRGTARHARSAFSRLESVRCEPSDGNSMA
jgi:hypothetical protein